MIYIQFGDLNSRSERKDEFASVREFITLLKGRVVEYCSASEYVTVEHVLTYEGYREIDQFVPFRCHSFRVKRNEMKFSSLINVEPCYISNFEVYYNKQPIFQCINDGQSTATKSLSNPISETESNVTADNR